MDIKLIALDLDGTLLASDHDTIPERNRIALQRAAEKGVHIAIASGRSWSLVREIAERLGRVSYGITGNGGCVVDAAGKPLARFPMDMEQSLEIIRKLQKRRIPFEIYVDGQNYLQRDGLERLDRVALSDAFLEMYLRNVEVVDDLYAFAAQHAPEKFDVFYVPLEEKDAVSAEILQGGLLSVSGGLDTNLEFTAPGVTKGTALAELARRLGLTASQVMAFGDADNDLEMLRWAEWSFSMENGSDGVKAAARYAAPSNDDAGVGRMVEKYVLDV